MQGGEQKTHTFYVAFGRDAVTDEPLDWCRTPLLPHATPAVVLCQRRAAVSDAPRRRSARRLSSAGGCRHRGRRHVRAQARGDRRVRLAAFRRHLRRPRGRLPPRARHRWCRITTTSTTRSPVLPISSSASATARWWRHDGRAGRPRHRHRHLPHRPRQVGLQPRPVLAHLPLRRRRHGHASLLPESVRRQGARRRAGQRAELRHRPDAALFPDRRSGRRARRPLGLAQLGDRHGRRPARPSSAGWPGADRAWPARAGRRTITVRAAAPPTPSPSCSTATA